MSVTIVGLVVAVLAKILQVAGVDVVNADLTNFVLTFAQVVGAVAVYVGRLRQGDITWYGTKRVTI